MTNEMDRRIRALIVDDESHIRAGLIMLLSDRFAAEFDEAADGETAADLLARNRYDFIFSDDALPGVHGWELLRSLRAGAYFDPIRLSGTPARTPFLLFSGSASGDHIYGAFGMHAFGLEKPLNIELLVAIFRGCMS